MLVKHLVNPLNNLDLLSAFDKGVEFAITSELYQSKYRLLHHDADSGVVSGIGAIAAILIGKGVPVSVLENLNTSPYGLGSCYELIHNIFPNLDFMRLWQDNDDGKSFEIIRDNLSSGNYSFITQAVDNHPSINQTPYRVALSLVI